MTPTCLECVAVLTRLGFGGSEMFAREAAALHVTVTEARRLWLARYHAQHTLWEEPNG